MGRIRVSIIVTISLYRHVFLYVIKPRFVKEASSRKNRCNFWHRFLMYLYGALCALRALDLTEKMKCIPFFIQLKPSLCFALDEERKKLVLSFYQTFTSFLYFIIKEWLSSCGCVSLFYFWYVIRNHFKTAFNSDGNDENIVHCLMYCVCLQRVTKHTWCVQR